MADFKVGDKVIVGNIKAGESTDGKYVNSTMAALHGQTLTIRKIDEDKDIFVHENSWYWRAGMFEPAGFTNGDIITDDTDREYYFVGYDHKGKVVAEDKYDDTWTYRSEDGNEFAGEIRLVSDKYEFTLEEVAKKLNVPVSKLRIKE